MVTESVNPVSPAPAPSPAAPSAPRTHHLSIALRPAQRAALEGFAQRYGLNQTVLIHMLIDMESDAHRLPAAILKAIRQLRTATPPAAPAPQAPLQNN